MADVWVHFNLTWLNSPFALQRASNIKYKWPFSLIPFHCRLALETILFKVGTVIMRNDSTDTSAHHILQPQHDIAVYSMCPSTNPILDIFRANNNSFNLYFDPPAPTMNDKRMYLSSAILRLFKVDRTSGNDDITGSSSNGECRWNPAHADELIRVTVSAYTKKSRKCKSKADPRAVIHVTKHMILRPFRPQEDVQQHHDPESLLRLGRAAREIHHWPMAKEKLGTVCGCPRPGWESTGCIPVLPSKQLRGM